MFRHDDIEFLLHLAGPEPAGQYDNKFQSIRPGAGATGDLREMASMHEMGHNDINTMSAYGNALTIYALLAEKKFPEAEKYRDILGLLVSRCRIAHETYATWSGLIFFAATGDDNLAHSILEGISEYQYFYDLACQLTAGISSMALRSIILQASVNFCFQSKVISEQILLDFRNPSLSTISYREFPDHRLMHILDHFPRPYFEDLLKEYAESKKDSPYHRFIQNELSASPEDYDGFMEDYSGVGKDLLHFIQDKLDRHFSALKSFSLVKDTYYDQFTKPLQNRIENAYPERAPLMRFFVNQGFRQEERFLMINFEKESVRMSPEPLKSFVQFPGDLSPELMAEIFREDKMEYLLVTCEHGLLLSNQYVFMNPEKSDKITQYESILAFICLTMTLNGEKVLLQIPFFHPDELTQFLAQKRESMLVFGAVSTSARSEDEWHGLWARFFIFNCTPWLYLNDVSLLFYLEKIFPELKSVSYSIIRETLDDRSYVSLVFRYILGEDMEMLLLAPCSDAHAEYATTYIAKYYPQYIKEDSPIEQYAQGIQTIFMDLLGKKHEFIMHTALLPDDFYIASDIPA